jgi:hypothetical protein
MNPGGLTEEDLNELWGDDWYAHVKELLNVHLL